jgi:hypothetical protein
VVTVAGTVLATVREMQVLLLALILLGACAAKLARVLRARSVQVIVDATALFPPRLRRRATMALYVTEMSLGLGLIVTAGQAGHGRWADGVRLATAFFFVLATCALVELRERRPDLGCGCFGDLSGTPPGARSVARSGLFAAAALASVHSGVLSVPPPGLAAAQVFGVLFTELLLVAVLSPELGEALVRLGYAEPCEVRPASPHRALTALRHSRAWRSHSGLITRDVPSDMWRELCWWYVVYPGRDGAMGSDIVFVVEVGSRRPAVRAAVVGRAGDPAARPADVTHARPAGGLSPAF